jgi:hypothetical protein
VDALWSPPRKRGARKAAAGMDSRFRGNDMREHLPHSVGDSQHTEKAGATAGTAAPAGGSTTTDYCLALSLPSARMTSVPSLRM